MRLVIYLKYQTIRSPMFENDSDNLRTLTKIQKKVTTAITPFRKYFLIKLNNWSVTIKVSDLVALEVR